MPRQIPHPRIDSPLRRRGLLLVLTKLLRRKSSAILESALRRLKLYDSMKKSVGRRKALIVACAYGNPMSRANTRDSGPSLPDPVSPTTMGAPPLFGMISDAVLEYQEPMESSIPPDGEPMVDGEVPISRGVTFQSGTPLKHSHRDGYNLRDLLKSKYRISDIEFLSDDGVPGHISPTADNIKAAITRLVEGTRPGDSLVFAFIGHGGQRTNLDGTEVDNKDEIIFAVDKDQMTAMIVDDDIHNLLVKPLPAGSKLTAIIDACHSGTALDLKYANEYFDADPGCQSDPERSPTESLMIVSRTKKVKKVAAPPRPSRFGEKFLFKPAPDEFSSDVQSKVNKAKVFCLSACRDEQETFEWKRGYTLTHFLVDSVLHEKGLIKQRKLLAKLSRRFAEVHEKCPKVPRSHPQLGSNIKRHKWKHEPFIAHTFPWH
ncbi:hypothetical protein AURDEDRAFT_185896 [Auricularia subglabra TFB-10046 SS5]|nr:hypothetical protein AURDEDRAFT_185896 [Auricularia subglabra TFB-10046 SS5]